MLTPRTWESVASSLFESFWSACICFVQPPVKAKMKNATTTFFFPRYWLKETSFKSLPSKYLIIKSGATSPTLGIDIGSVDEPCATAGAAAATANAHKSSDPPNAVDSLFCISNPPTRIISHSAARNCHLCVIGIYAKDTNQYPTFSPFALPCGTINQ